MEDARLIGRFPAGRATPPPSKSLSQRAIICGALAARRGAGGESLIRNLDFSEDVSASVAAVRALGARTERRGDVLRILPGRGPGSGLIDCGESGATLRFMLPIAALDDRETVFTGRGRLLERPLAAYAGVFAAAGARFSQEPHRVVAQGPLRGGDYALPGDVSSQFVSGLLLALPLAPGDSRIRLTTRLESRPYVDLTLEVMKRFGVTAEGVGDDAFEVRGGQSYQPADYLVEADYSQAAFFLAAAALGRPARCAGLDPSSRQGDRAILSILAEMGATVGWESGEAVVRAGVLRAVEADVRETPDLAPVLAVLCALGDGVSRIVGAARLRLKECDRLKAMASELRKLGADIEEGEDSLTITGRPSLTGGRVDAHNDHRVAMALAVAAIGCDGPVYLTGWRSVDKSYPSFWDDFERAGR